MMNNKEGDRIERDYGGEGGTVSDRFVRKYLSEKRLF